MHISKQPLIVTHVREQYTPAWTIDNDAMHTRIHLMRFLVRTDTLDINVVVNSRFMIAHICATHCQKRRPAVEIGTSVSNAFGA